MWLRARLPKDLLFVMFAFNHRSGSWSTVRTDKIPARMDFGMVAVDQQIVAVGGRNGAVFFKDTSVFYCITGEWAEKAPMAQPRAYASVATLEGKVYAFGGSDSLRQLNVVQQR